MRDITIKRTTLMVAITFVVAVSTTSTVASYSELLIDGQIAAYKAGGVLPNNTDYAWWYGCSPTSAGMMMGYYDRNGYNGLYYPDLVPGGTAEASTWGIPGGDALVDPVIASHGYQYDFYGNVDESTDRSTFTYDTGGGPGDGFGYYNDDLAQPWHDFDCLGDFMGTSQDSVDNVNGYTTFIYYTDGSPLNAYEMPGYGIQDYSGMYGIGEYVTYAGYSYNTLYNQYIDTLGLTYGFTYAQYCAEIDAGRPVLIHIEGHTMFGYGYDNTVSPLVYVYDTWGPGFLPWGSTYGGELHYGVTVMEIAGGVHVPAPGAILLGSIGVGLVGWLRRRQKL